MINERALKVVLEEFFLTDSEMEELLHLVEERKVWQNTEQCDYDSNPQLGNTAHPPYTHLLMFQVVKRYFEIVNEGKIGS
ncbi:MAG TPA: hypothetical protein VHT73_17285 [Thermodesulfobacteriota bacterium]|nr:hypothetical protein [Thermodesulfobacteriota bacterium]